MIILKVFFSFILMGYGVLNAQEIKKFSLKEAQQYAIENNYQIKNARIDIEIAKQRVKENTAIGLPQINIQASYNYFMDIPTTLMPNFLTPAIIMVDTMIFDLTAPDSLPSDWGNFEVKFGTPHNATLGGTISQLLFSGQYLVGLQAAKAYESLTYTTFAKSEIEIKDAVAKCYFPVMIIKENKIYLDSTLASMKKMLYETEEYYKSGFVEDTDVDQLKLMIADMETALVNIDNQLKIAINMLKFILGLKSNDQIEITENLHGLLTSIDNIYTLSSGFEFKNHIDYNILKKSERLNYLQMKLAKSAFYPTLSAFYSYQQNALREKFNFFDKDQPWFPTQILGFQLDIPVWSSGMRKYKVNQAKLELEKIKVQDMQLQQKLNLDLETGRSAFNNAYLIYTNRLKNIDLAEKIHQKTEIKYKEGLSSSLDLSQSYNQYLNSEVNYLSSVLDLLIKKSDLDKLLTKAAN